MVGGLRSEWWARSDQNAARLQIGIGGRLTSEFAATLRLRPDRIIVGEVRGGEALAMLKAWNTGHPGGICTVHANHARAGLTRIEQMIAEVSQTPMRALIAEAVNLIVSIVRTDHGTRPAHP